MLAGRDSDNDVDEAALSRVNAVYEERIPREKMRQCPVCALTVDHEAVLLPHVQVRELITHFSHFFMIYNLR